MIEPYDGVGHITIRGKAVASHRDRAVLRRGDLRHVMILAGVNRDIVVSVCNIAIGAGAGSAFIPEIALDNDVIFFARSSGCRVRFAPRPRTTS